jgi:hypothetical protein
MEMGQIPSSKWSFNAAMRRQGEEVGVPDEVLAKVEDVSGAREFNEGIRESAEVVADVDRWFTHLIKHFRNGQEVAASIQVEQGRHGEYGWGYTSNKAAIVAYLQEQSPTDQGRRP